MEWLSQKQDITNLTPSFKGPKQRVVGKIVGARVQRVGEKLCFWTWQDPLIHELPIAVVASTRSS